MGLTGCLAFFLVFSAGTVKGELLNGCPEEFVRLGSLCANFAMDKQACHKMNPAADLAPVKDQKTYQWLLKLLSTDPPFNLLLGLMYTSRDNTWRWADGTVYNPTTDWSVWRNGKVPTPTTDRCGIWKKSGKIFEWDVTDCASTGIYICSMNATTDSQNCPDGYLQKQDMCWMSILKLDHSYNTGLQQCQESNGYPPMTKSEIEYSRFLSLYGSTVSRLAVLHWFGLKYVGSEKKWKWADGTDYNPETQVNLWENQQMPADVDTEDVCVNLVVILVNETQTLQWGTADCDSPAGFMLCTKSAAINVKIANGCPLHFSRTGNHCIYNPFYAKQWIDWERDCKVRGGSLFAPKNLSECQEVLGKGAQDGTGCVDVQNKWAYQQTVGLKYIAKEKTWRWSDGTVYNPATDWALWRNGSAPNPDHDTCVIWTRADLPEFKWDLVQCNNNKGHVLGICYAKATADAQLCADGYTLEGEVCVTSVKPLQGSYGYDHSQAVCKNKSNGSIFMVKSEADVALMLSQNEGFSAEGMKSFPSWVGVKYEVSEKKWKWSDGTEYKMGVDYGNWDDDVPATPTEDMCIALNVSSVNVTDPKSYIWRVRSCESNDFVVYFCENELLNETQKQQTSDFNMSENGPSAQANQPISTTAYQETEVRPIIFASQAPEVVTKGNTDFGDVVVASDNTSGDVPPVANSTQFNPEFSTGATQQMEMISSSSDPTSQTIGVTTSSTTDLKSTVATDKTAEYATQSNTQVTTDTSPNTEVATIPSSLLPANQTLEINNTSDTDLMDAITSECIHRPETENATPAVQIFQSTQQMTAGAYQNTEMLATPLSLLPRDQNQSLEIDDMNTTDLMIAVTTNKTTNNATGATEIIQADAQKSTNTSQKLEMPAIPSASLPTSQTLVLKPSSNTDLKNNMANADKKGENVTAAVPATQANQQMSKSSSRNAGTTIVTMSPIFPVIQILVLGASALCALGHWI